MKKNNQPQLVELGWKLDLAIHRKEWELARDLVGAIEGELKKIRADVSPRCARDEFGKPNKKVKAIKKGSATLYLEHLRGRAPSGWAICKP